MKLSRGSVVLVDLVDLEQRGTRPCVVVSDPEVIADQRYALVCVVPVTGAPGQGSLYPPLAPGKNGLKKRSYALLDQLRSLDKRRVLRVFGRVGRDELLAMDMGLRQYLGLGP